MHSGEGRSGDVGGANAKPFAVLRGRKSLRAAALDRVLLWIAALGIVVAVPTAWAQSKRLDPEELYEQIAPSIWVVVADVGDEKFRQGSAVVVAPETLITNCHVVEKAKAIVVLYGETKVRARLQYHDPSRDLCQLEAPGLIAPVVRMVSAAPLRVGAKVYAIGNPRGLELTLSDGLISGLRRGLDGALEALQISVPISPGSSGGGLFDVYGRLIGITTSGLRDSQNLNFALPADWIVQLPGRVGGIAIAVLDRSDVLAARPQEPPPAQAPAPVVVAAAPAPVHTPREAPRPVPAPVPVAALPPREPPAEMPPVISKAPASVQPPQADVVPAPAPVDVAALPPRPPTPAPVTAPVLRDVLPPADPVLVVGTELEYWITDRLTGSVRTVSYRVDQIQGDRVVFNDGVRIESLRGEVLTLGPPVAGELEAVMPPGGWMKPGARPGDEWALKYSTRPPQEYSGMELRARVVGTEQIELAGHKLQTLRVEFQGYTDRAITLPANASGHYKATAWYSTQLGRIVRFDVKSQGGTMASKFVIDEVLQLVAIRIRSDAPMTR